MPDLREAGDPFGDHRVSCGHAAFGKRHLGVQQFLCQVLSAARVPHDREVSVEGDLARPVDVLLREWTAPDSGVGPATRPRLGGPVLHPGGKGQVPW